MIAGARERSAGVLPENSAASLVVEGLRAGYASVPVLHGIDLRVERNEVVVLLGANGAGKTTTMMAISGALPALSGTVRINGVADRRPLHRRARDGLAFVTEERSIFTQLTCAENLRLGRGGVAGALDVIPELERLLNRKAGFLSGGEQQMLTLARAIASRPAVLLADELSLGLAPIIVDRLLEVVRRTVDRGFGALLVEQKLHQALTIADRCYVLRRGKIVFEGTAEETRRNVKEIERSYLSLGAAADAGE
jgi:branched-chain amino acid transport system ATP-binding protein